MELKSVPEVDFTIKNATLVPVIRLQILTIVQTKSANLGNYAHLFQRIRRTVIPVLVIQMAADTTALITRVDSGHRFGGIFSAR